MEFGPFSSTPHQGIYTQLGLRLSRRAAALSDESFHSGSFRCCAFSRATCAVGTHTPTGPFETFHRRSPPFPSSVQQSLKSGSQRSSGPERPLALGLVCPGEGSAWWTQAWRESSDRRRMASRQMSFPGVEMDAWSPLEGPAVRQVQSKDVLST